MMDSEKIAQLRALMHKKQQSSGLNKGGRVVPLPSLCPKGRGQEPIKALRPRWPALQPKDILGKLLDSVDICTEDSQKEAIVWEPLAELPCSEKQTLEEIALLLGTRTRVPKKISRRRLPKMRVLNASCETESREALVPVQRFNGVAYINSCDQLSDLPVVHAKQSQSQLPASLQASERKRVFVRGHLVPEILKSHVKGQSLAHRYRPMGLLRRLEQVDLPVEEQKRQAAALPLPEVSSLATFKGLPGIRVRLGREEEDEQLAEIHTNGKKESPSKQQLQLEHNQQNAAIAVTVAKPQSEASDNLTSVLPQAVPAKLNIKYARRQLSQELDQESSSHALQPEHTNCRQNVFTKCTVGGTQCIGQKKQKPSVTVNLLLPLVAEEVLEIQDNAGPTKERSTGTMEANVSLSQSVLRPSKNAEEQESHTLINDSNN